MSREKPYAVLICCICAVAAVAWCSPAFANVILTGNTHGNPVEAPKDPCPEHGIGYHCKSTLNPTDVTLITAPTDSIKQLVQDSYPTDDGWEWHFLGGNSNMNGKFDVDLYRAYNECPDKLGAEIRVTFVPDEGSLIDDVLWVSGLTWNFRCYEESTVDDAGFLAELGGNTGGTMFGPFYPFQDEDEDPPRWQTSYLYDQFYDKPGRRCPPPGVLKWARFETYATWWDDYFDADGNIVDLGDDGHHVFVHEGFAWGVDLYCIPEPATLCLSALGVLALLGMRRHRG